ncbi:hypothetical protein ACF09L_00910 [Streptomyces sp. NPDC014779]|uniref:hypothetical protein n=1 Tax=unclassified Streptomyces TaxID=2593676 RepID=UPI0036FCF303
MSTSNPSPAAGSDPGAEPAGPRHVRVTIELIAEITDEEALRAAALEQVRDDAYMEEAERAEAVEAIGIDPSGSLAHFIDPVALLGSVPGVELAAATWESARTEYDPDEETWEEHDLA